MKTTEKILKELILIVILFFSTAFLIRSIISCRNEISGSMPQKERHQIQEMKDYHRTEGREIQTY